MIDGSREQGLKESCKTCGTKATFSVLPIGRRSYKKKITKNKGTGCFGILQYAFFVLLFFFPH